MLRKLLGRKKREITLTFGERSWQRLGALQQATEEGTKEAVIKSALQLFEYMAQQLEAGSTFMVRKADGAIEDIELLGDISD